MSLPSSFVLADRNKKYLSNILLLLLLLLLLLSSSSSSSSSSFQPHYDPAVHSASSTIEYQKSLLGLKAAWHKADNLTVVYELIVWEV
jgi:hypothetical protein